MTAESAAPAHSTPRPASPEPWWSAVPPASGSIVMATGIVSIGLHVAGFETLSKILMGIDIAVWLLLAAAFVTRVFRDPHGWKAAADTPPALTAVAATTVLGTRLALFDRPHTAYALLAIAALAWPILLGSVVRHLGHRMPGAVFLVCVATQGLAVLAGQLALQGEGEWLAWAALVLFALGLILYAVVLTRFDIRQLRTGAGDHWVAGGAMAISAVAGSKLVASPVWTGTAHDILRITTLVVLGVALGWYAVLVVAEIAYPRPRYDIRRWATVFPLGMTAAACLLVSTAAHVAWLDTLGRVLLWIAFAVWVLTGVGSVRSLAGAVRGRAG